MAPAWGRAWRSKITSTAHGGNTREGDDRRSLQPPTAGWSESTTASGTTTTTGTTSSGPVVREPSFDFFQHRSTAAVVEEIGEEERVKKLEHIKALVVRFPSDDSTPERWLSELQVNWVLHLAHVSEFGRSFISGQLLYFARSWILAFLEITKSVYLQFGGGWCISKEEDGDGPPPASEFKRFVEATWSKMLPFVDAIVAVRTCLPDDRRRRAEEPADEKLQALILLRDALSTAEEILVHDALPTASEQSISACAETLDLLSVELLMAKLDEAVWDTMEETKACVLSSWRGTPRSPDIHPITRSFISYIKVLWDNYGSVYRILHTDNENANHLTDLTIEMVRSLEEKLTEKSQSFPDQSLNFLFLINNFHFVLQQLWPLGFPMPELAGKIHDHVNSYIQVSWAPVLKCLHNPTLHCFTRHSPLPKFESKFQNTYTAQKLWKVPDPEMRKRMREAIVEEVIPDFTEFLKDNTNSTPRITPQEMKRMLRELFEG